MFARTLSNRTKVVKANSRSFFNFGKKQPPSRAFIFDSDQQLQIDKYRGETEDFLEKVD